MVAQNISDFPQNPEICMNVQTNFFFFGILTSFKVFSFMFQTYYVIFCEILTIFLAQNLTAWKNQLLECLQFWNEFIYVPRPTSYNYLFFCIVFHFLWVGGEALKGHALLLWTAALSLIVILLWCVPLVNKLLITFHSFQDPTVDKGKKKEKGWEGMIEEEGNLEESRRREDILRRNIDEEIRRRIGGEYEGGGWL